MSRRTAAWLARSIWVFCALFTATALVIAGLGVSTGISFVKFGAAFNTAAIAITFSTVGAAVASRRSENPIGWIMCTGGLGAALGSLTDACAVYSLFRSPEGQMPGAALSAWVSLWSTNVVIGSFSLLLLLFPDGRLPSRRWRPVVWLVVVAVVVQSASWAFLTERFVGYGGIGNPFHVAALNSLQDAYATYARTPLSILTVLLPAVAVIARFWRSRGVERQQLKWFVSSGVLVVLGVVLILAVEIFLDEEKSQLFLTVFFVFTTLALCGIPISMGVAILRYRLYDIDLIINRTLVYGALTIALAALYFGGIVVLQRVFVVLTGQKSTLAVVASTLLIAALFNPLRGRIQGFIDRRFYRNKYDAAKTLAAFNARLREQTDLDTLSSDVVRVVRETMQPVHVSLWLHPIRTRNTSRNEKAS